MPLTARMSLQRRLLASIILFGLVVLQIVATRRAAFATDSDQQPDAAVLTDTKGNLVLTRKWHDTKVVVAICISTDCPVSNGYTPEYQRLAKQFAAQGVEFYLIHCDPDVTAEAATAHAKEFQIDIPILLDPKQDWAQQAGVTRTPTAVVYEHGKLVYRGRVDDRYTGDGKRRPEARKHDLEEAITAALDGKTTSLVETEAYGCPLPKVHAAETK